MSEENVVKPTLGHLEMSAEPALDGMLVVRWREQMPWGTGTHLITLSRPETIDDIRAAYARFEKLPAELRDTTATALRHAGVGVSWEAIVAGLEPVAPPAPEPSTAPAQDDGQLGFVF